MGIVLWYVIKKRSINHLYINEGSYLMEEIEEEKLQIMGKWYEEFKDREIKPEDLGKLIRPGSRIFIGSGCSEPEILTKQLVKKKWRFTDCELIHFLTLSDNNFFDEKNPSLFRHQALFIGPKLRDAVNEGKVDYVPISLSDIPRLFKERRIHVDIALLQVSPPDRFGFCSLGINVDINRTIIEVAKIIIVQINPKMPRTMGDSFVHIKKFNYFVYHNSPIIEFKYPPIDARSDKIGRYIARIIENGSTLQFGIGSIPNAVLKYLGKKKNLAIYSEVLSDSAVDLIESSVVNCSKNQFPHVMTSFVMGSRKLYDFVHENPFIEFRPTEFINNIFNIAQNTKQVSINSALSVSLTGQVNSDSVGTKFYSGIGGQADFTRGAALSKRGKPIICLPSTTSDGTKSRIVATLEPGAGVVIPRGDVHYVVTEYGIAFLHGKSIRDRVLQMIGIAHPKFRQFLLQKAKEMHYVYEDQMLPTTQDGIVIIYPEKYEYWYTTKNKGKIFFRPIKPTDERLLQELYYELSDDDRVLRFFAPRQVFPHKETQPKVVVDYETTFVLVGIVGDEETAKMIAAGSYYLDHNTNLAEIAFTVHEDWRRQGLTRFMVMKLIDIAQEKGISGFIGEILSNNEPMIHIIKTLPYKVEFHNYGDSFEFSFKFSDVVKKEK
ncbi:MAG: GNAT family N-acetyltransferase [Promethearchaeota archaeon]